MAERTNTGAGLCSCACHQSTAIQTSHVAPCCYPPPMSHLVTPGGVGDHGSICDHVGTVLDRPESDTWECLACGHEGNGEPPDGVGDRARDAARLSEGEWETLSAHRCEPERLAPTPDDTPLVGFPWRDGLDALDALLDDCSQVGEDYHNHVRVSAVRDIVDAIRRYEDAVDDSIQQATWEDAAASGERWAER
jgi:hypothetical protein